MFPMLGGSALQCWLTSVWDQSLLQPPSALLPVFLQDPPPPPFGLGGGGPVRLQVEGCAQGLAGGLTVSDMPQDPCPWVAEQCLACQHVVLKDWSDI